MFTKNIEDEVYIFDTTLRDGEQATGNHINAKKKIKIARALAALGVDHIEAGFAISSPGDYKAVKTIAKEVGTQDGPTIVSLAMATKSNIDAAADAISEAYHGRIHTFIATSDIHIKHKLRKSHDEVYKNAVDAVTYAKSFADDVEFSLEDFSRTRMDYAIKVVCGVIDAGATTVNLPDTVGRFTPWDTYTAVKEVIDSVHNTGRDAIFSFHGHDDEGMAAANTLAAINAGARQVEVTINGVGERAGNAALEEVVVAMRNHTIGYHRIQTPMIKSVSVLVSEYMRSPVPRNKAIVGENAFRHSAGIHADGQNKRRDNYEHIDPKDVGATSKIICSVRTGRKGIMDKFEQMGISLNGNTETVYNQFLGIADIVEETDDADFISATMGSTHNIPTYVSIGNYVASTTAQGANAGIEVSIDGKTTMATALAKGQVGAGIKAINEVIDQSYTFEMRQDPRIFNRMIVEIEKDGFKVKSGYEHDDGFTASINAYVGAVNRMMHIEKYMATQEQTIVE